MTRRRNKRRATDMLADAPQSTAEFIADRDAGEDYTDEEIAVMDATANISQLVGRALGTRVTIEDLSIEDATSKDVFLGQREREPTKEETEQFADRIARGVEEQERFEQRDRKRATLMAAREDVRGDINGDDADKGHDMEKSSRDLRADEPTYDELLARVTKAEAFLTGNACRVSDDGEWAFDDAFVHVVMTREEREREQAARLEAKAAPGLLLEELPERPINIQTAGDPKRCTAEGVLFAAAAMFGGVLNAGKHSHNIDDVMGQCVHRALRMRTMIESALDSEHTLEGQTDEALDEDVR